MTFVWLTTQILGVCAVIAGVFLAFGLAFGLIAGGVIVAGVAEMRT